MKTKPIIAGVALLVVLAAVGGGLALVKYRAIKAAASAPSLPPPEFVDVIEAATMNWQPTARLVGTVFAKRSVTLANEVVGMTTAVGFDSGEEVQAGQVLVQMDISTEKADLAAAEASARVARAAIDVALANINFSQSNLELAQSNQRRFQGAGTSVSATDLDRTNSELAKAKSDLARQQSELERAKAEVDRADSQIRQIQSRIDKKTLKAPFRARVGMRTVQPGQYLGEGTSIVSLSEITDDIYLDFAVPQEYAPRVVPGTVVVANSNMLGNEAVKITVVSIDATVNPTTRNVRVRSTVANLDHRLKPGMFIDIEVPVEAPKQYVAIPTTAVRRGSIGDHVFVLNPGDPAKDLPESFHAQQRMVTLGPDIAGKVIISAGLKAGELVAASGSFKLREGAVVMKAPPVAPRADPAAAAPADVATAAPAAKK